MTGAAEAMKIYLGQDFYYLNPQNKGRKRPKLPQKWLGHVPSVPSGSTAPAPMQP